MPVDILSETSWKNVISPETEETQKKRMVGHRSRPLKGIPEMGVQKDQSYSRQRTSTPRRNKYGSENMPPEDDNIRANMPSEVLPSPALNKCSSARFKNAGSPALPPRPPSRQLQGKRKLNLDCHPETAATTPEKICLDTGVKVIVRMRPLTRDEQDGSQIVQKVSYNTVAVVDQHFTFDAVAGTESSQQEVFEMVGVPLVENCLAGFNSSIFAYGQTGSGKTYTMWGPANVSIEKQNPIKDRGITPRVFELLFARIQEEENKYADKQLHYQCRCSFLEIYNEQITDLLEPNQRNLQIREDTKIGVYVENLTEEYVSSIDDVTQLLLRGLANRRVGATSINAESSRSHSVFTCALESRCKSVADGLSSLRTSRINLVDLAGSERQKVTGAAGERLKEAGNINRSLSQLGNLINILAEVSQTGKQRHIPYRDSRLTFLLQESLGGNAKLAMICAISPASSCRSETLSTLRFAQRAKAIQNKAVVNEETENDVNFLREQIRLLKDELVRMKSNDNGQVTPTSGGYSTSWNARRSFNRLRFSLNRPLMLPHTDTDSDEEMEIEEESVEKLCVELGIQSADFDETTKDSQTSSSSENEKETIQTELDDLKRENLSDSTKIDINGDVTFLQKGSVLDNGENAGITNQTARDGKMEDNRTETTLTCQIENGSESCSSSGIQGDPASHCEMTYKEESVLTSHMVHSESSDVNCRSSEVELVPSSVISEINPTAHKDDQVHQQINPYASEVGLVTSTVISEIHLKVHTDDHMLIDHMQVHQPINPSASDAETNDCTPVAKDLSSGPHTDSTSSVPDAPVIVDDVLHVSPSQQSPSLSIIPCQPPATLQSPTLSISPRIQDDKRSMIKSLQRSPLSGIEDGNSKLSPELLSISFAESLRKSSHARSSTRSNKSLISPTDSLAASLHRGLQIIDHHQKTSALRKSSVRFSFQTLDLKSQYAVDKVDIGVQTSPEKMISAATSPIPEFLCSSSDKLDVIQQLAIENKEDMQDKSQWQLIPVEEPKTPDGPQHRLSRAVEGVLAGAIRREMALEEACNKQAAQIEQLNRLIRQYKHERECNSIIQQSREDKIVRLEGLMDGVIPTEDFMDEEFVSLMNEHKLLKDKYENHPEVTRANIEQKCLQEELEKYRNFYELGERDALLEEIQHLRTQLQCYLDCGSSPMSARKRRLSLAPQSMHRSETCESVRSLSLCTIPEASIDNPIGASVEIDTDVHMSATEKINQSLPDEKWEEERQQWTQRESEWISLAEELRIDLDSQRRLAEKRKQEVECEQRCSEELKEALQMAMEGHARLLDQYAELQEKHIALLARHRKIKEGVADVKRAAAKAGVKGAELRFIEAQAAELVALKLERDRERKMMKEEIKGLQDQLTDTAEAVQAAGELLVRLKEAEEAVSIAQDSAAIAEHDAEIVRRDMDKLNRRHATEMATLNQRLLETRLLKSTVCPMCQVADRVKFEFPEPDEATLAAEAAAVKEAQNVTKSEWRGQFEPFPHEFEDNDFLRMGEPSWLAAYDRCNI